MKLLSEKITTERAHEESGERAVGVIQRAREGQKAEEKPAVVCCKCILEEQRRRKFKSAKTVKKYKEHRVTFRIVFQRFKGECFLLGVTAGLVQNALQGQKSAYSQSQLLPASLPLLYFCLLFDWDRAFLHWIKKPPQKVASSSCTYVPLLLLGVQTAPFTS